MANDKRKGNSPGPSVDATGTPVVDPTENVKEILRAAVQRQDDLREADRDHLGEMAKLRAEYDDKLREAESKRIDAIRAVDVGAVNRAAEVSAAQAQILATQVSVSAETLRTQVQAAAQAATTSLAAALEPIQKDIADLRRVQYEQQGQKAAVGETKGDSSARVAVIVAVIGALVFLVSVAALIISVTRKGG